MDAEINGNRLSQNNRDEPESSIEHEESSHNASGISPALNEADPPSRAMRIDALKAAATDRKSIAILGAGLGVAVILFLLTTLFGKAPSKKATSAQKTVPASSPAKPRENVTPLMDAVRSNSTSDSVGQVTPADIHRTKTNSPPQNDSAPAPASHLEAASSGRTLASIPSFDSTQQHWEEPRPYGEQQMPVPTPGATAQAVLLEDASLVFVKKIEPVGAIKSSSLDHADVTAPELSVVPGTRIQARLETQASSAVSAPVVAVVEYTYSLGDRLVIPAGARVYGQLQQADKSGAVSIKFNEIELLDGVRGKIEAIGTSLELGPIKGMVSGKNTGRNFLVRTASGIGSIAAMVVGNNTSSAFSEDDLVRQRIAENVGNAGDNEIMNMALTNRIVVSVPADTPIYIVFTKRGEAAGSPSKGSTN